LRWWRMNLSGRSPMQPGGVNYSAIAPKQAFSAARLLGWGGKMISRTAANCCHNVISYSRAICARGRSYSRQQCVLPLDCMHEQQVRCNATTSSIPIGAFEKGSAWARSLALLWPPVDEIVCSDVTMCRAAVSAWEKAGSWIHGRWRLGNVLWQSLCRSSPRPSPENHHA